MTEPTVSLATLRRAIARELNMPFFKRYKNGYLDADSGDTDSLIDSALTQKDKFWNGAWVYRVASQEASLITNFSATLNELSFETPITTIVAGDDYEIHNHWNAYDIHEAINAAIRDARRTFTETITDETLVIEDDALSYSLAGLARTPFLIHKVWLEPVNSETDDWYPWPALRYDSTKEFPDVLYFSRRPINFVGKHIRIEYSALPNELSAEADTTTIPMSYLVPAAISKLHGKKIGDTKVDRELHFAESRRYGDIAEAWLLRNAPHRPDNDILKQHSGSYQPDSMNPLNWG